MKLIGLMGYAGAGKDALAATFVNHGWTRISFADPVRAAAMAIDPIIDFTGNGDRLKITPVRLSQLVKMYGWTKAKECPEVRRLLQLIGTEGGREIHGPDCWVEIARKSILTDGSYIFTDVRFLNEFNLIYGQGGAVYYVERPGLGPVNNHVSDQQLSSMRSRCLATITNSGTLADLEALALELVGLARVDAA